jgi:DNA-directed RNA polymerase subunit RPC12/RpoP
VAKWMLICPHCSHRFAHSNVDPAMVELAGRDPFKIVPKPKFTNGETMKCPSCSKESLFRAFELIYSGDETALGAVDSG